GDLDDPRILATCSGAQTSTTGCDSTRQYTGITSLISSSPIYNDMMKYWISYKGTDTASYDSFWAHEWGKHGTCWSPADLACTGSSPADVETFFGAVLKAHSKYDFFAPLYNAGIIPNGNTYAKSAFTAAIVAAFPGTSVGYVCTGAYVNEIHLSLVAVGGGGIAVPSTLDPETDNCPTQIIYAAPPGATTSAAVKATTTVAVKSTTTAAPAKTYTTAAQVATTSGVFGAKCAHSPCIAGAVLSATCDPCVAKIGALSTSTSDMYYHCVNVGWKNQCVAYVASVCGIQC
ncbi:ribonuclease T2-like, partial [Podochytrium sp. JEL0797]